MGGSGAQKPGDDPEPFLVPDAADRRHAGKDVLDGSGLGPRVLVPLGIPCIFPAWCRPSTRPGWGRCRRREPGDQSARTHVQGRGGTCSYAPRALLKVIVYAYLGNIYSGRQIAKAVQPSGTCARDSSWATSTPTVSRPSVGHAIQRAGEYAIQRPPGAAGMLSLALFASEGR